MSNLATPATMHVSFASIGEAQAGFCYLDTTIGKPIWYTGSAWIDATGATV